MGHFRGKERIRRMRRLLALFLLLVLVGNLAGVAMGETAGDQPGLMLTVSKITFSTVGESEYIYAGSIPLDQVSWISDDESIVTVDNGVLTAAGVGSTTVWAYCGTEEVVCLVSCLAKDAERLLSVEFGVLQEPKRTPPRVDMEPEEYFSDAVFIGDSITYNMMVHENNTGLLGHPLILARKNVGVHNFLMRVLNVFYQGREYYLEDAIAACGKKRAYLLLGMNDISYHTPEELVEEWLTLCDRIHEKAPDVELVMLTCLPKYFDVKRFTEYNDKIDVYNALLKVNAPIGNYRVVDLAAYIEDHLNGMAKSYNLDKDVHLNYDGSVIWMHVMRADAYAQRLNEK